MVDRLNIIAWHDLVRGVYDAAPGVRGALGAIALLNQAAGAAAELVGRVSSDVYAQQSLLKWTERHQALNLRIGYYLEQVARPLDGSGVTYDQVEPYVWPPIIEGKFPADFGGVIVGRLILRRGLEQQPDGTYSSMGDAIEAGMLWNEAVEALALSEEIDSTEALPRWLRAILSQARREVLENAAPHEDTTVRDEVEKKLDEAAEKVGELVEEAAAAVTGLGVSGLLFGVGLVVGGYYALRAIMNRRGK